jgi:hypothetical protein
MNNKLKYIVTLTIGVIIIGIVREFYKEYKTKIPPSEFAKSEKLLISENPWYTGVYSGIKILTPEKLNENAYNMTESEKSVASKIGSYSFTSNEIYILVRYLKGLSSEVEYDLERGLNTVISKGVNRLGGTNLTFNTEGASDGNKKVGFGTFQAGREIMEYKEIIYFNGKNEVGVVMIIGPQSDYTKQLISKIINSVEYNF